MFTFCIFVCILRQRIWILFLDVHFPKFCCKFRRNTCIWFSDTCTLSYIMLVYIPARSLYSVFRCTLSQILYILVKSTQSVPGCTFPMFIVYSCKQLIVCSLMNNFVAKSFERCSLILDVHCVLCFVCYGKEHTACSLVLHYAIFCWEKHAVCS